MDYKFLSHIGYDLYPRCSFENKGSNLSIFFKTSDNIMRINFINVNLFKINVSYNSLMKELRRLRLTLYIATDGGYVQNITALGKKPNITNLTLPNLT